MYTPKVGGVLIIDLFSAWSLKLQSLLGTFLVRSGILTSVHAFAVDPKRGIFILAFLLVVIGGSLVLYAWRARQVGLGSKFDLVSRESLLLSNNVLLTVAAGSVLLGTLYPLIVDALGQGLDVRTLLFLDRLLKVTQLAHHAAKLRSLLAQRRFSLARRGTRQI